MRIDNPPTESRRLPRLVPPCERHCGCPTCHVKPGQRCITTRPIHMQPWSAADLRYVGSPTSPHQARVRLWAHLLAGEIMTFLTHSPSHEERCVETLAIRQIWAALPEWAREVIMVTADAESGVDQGPPLAHVRASSWLRWARQLWLTLWLEGETPLSGETHGGAVDDL